ncbi:hypothetical protein B296_00015819, partial [Ensete ventricosum]
MDMVLESLLLEDVKIHQWNLIWLLTTKFWLMQLLFLFIGRNLRLHKVVKSAFQLIVNGQRHILISWKIKLLLIGGWTSNLDG